MLETSWSRRRSAADGDLPSTRRRNLQCHSTRNIGHRAIDAIVDFLGKCFVADFSGQQVDHSGHWLKIYWKSLAMIEEGNMVLLNKNIDSKGRLCCALKAMLEEPSRPNGELLNGLPSSAWPPWLSLKLTV